MAVYGADVEQLHQLGRQMGTSARQIESLRGALDAQIRATQTWRGPDAERFRADWSSRIQAQLKVVSSALETAANVTARNAQEQTDASAASGGTLRGDAGGTASGAAGGLASGTAVADGSAESNVFTWAKDQLDGQIPGAPAGMTWSLALGKIPHVGNVVDALTIGGTALDPGQSVLHRAEGIAIGGADAFGGALRSGSLGLPGYLAGVAVSQWSDVADAVTKADFSPGTLSATGAYIAKDPWGAASAGAEAVVSYLPKLASNFWPW